MSEHGQALAAGVALLERAIDYTLGSLRMVTPAALCRPTPCAGWNLQRLLDHLNDSLHALNDAATGHIPPPHTPTRPATTPPPGTSESRPSTPPGMFEARTPTPPGIPWSRIPSQPGTTSQAIPTPPEATASAPTPPGAAEGVVPPPRGAAGRVWGPNPALLLRDGATEVLGRWTAMLTDDLIAVGDRHLTSPMVAAVGAIEVAVHGWDVATACGEHRPIPSLMAEELLDLALVLITRHDRPARFARPVAVPEHAPAQDHLLAYLGRHPDWFVCN
ncbi:maleylpyruvate isomerase N-terminal domain-containing protein [Nonomuraea sp. NPDC050643]|uniref:maleylpyruvate isomerase N-terminal domain-containing protein n=1 Tax=Nonomuraea sp. NPDC050643 TaxID=3155660 RepID=UPI0033F5AF93